MRDVQLAELGARQFNRVSRRQMLELGYSQMAITHRLRTGRLFQVEEGVFALAPPLDHDTWGGWMAATLTTPGSFLSHTSAAAAREFWPLPKSFETVTRVGSGGPVRHGGVLVYRSTTVAADTEELDGIPITTVPRTLLDLARIRVSERALARAVREAIRLKCTNEAVLAEAVIACRGRRGSRLLITTVTRYSGLPLARARSGAEIRALEVLRDAECSMPRLNYRIAGEEADLSWPRDRLIIEIDGGPFHLDVGEAARKQTIWERAGWIVRRIDSDDVYERPHLLLALSPD